MDEVTDGVWGAKAGTRQVSAVMSGPCGETGPKRGWCVIALIGGVADGERISKMEEPEA